MVLANNMNPFIGRFKSRSSSFAFLRRRLGADGFPDFAAPFPDFPALSTGSLGGVAVLSFDDSEGKTGSSSSSSSSCLISGSFFISGLGRRVNSIVFLQGGGDRSGTVGENVVEIFGIDGSFSLQENGSDFCKKLIDCKITINTNMSNYVRYS